MHVVLFEDPHWANFAPLSINRPIFQLAVGAFSILEKTISRLKPTRLTLWVRPGLARVCRDSLAPTLPVPTAVNAPLDDEPAMLVSGRTIFLSAVQWPTDPCVSLDAAGEIAGAFARAPGLSPEDVFKQTDAWQKLLDQPRVPPAGTIAKYLWDLIGLNESALVADANFDRDAFRHPRPAGPYHLVQDRDVLLGADARLEPGCVLDASKGAILLDDSAVIGANAVVAGPCYIGRQSQVAPLAHIRPGTTVGPMCKVGGEIGNSILLGYSNKAHDGYLGDSYLGQWVNLGAGTTTSNLKNTYGPVRVRLGDRRIETDRQFLGSLIADHAKTAIGTRLMSGSYIGFGSVIATSQIPPTYIPSFRFITDKVDERYHIDKAREVMKQVYGRRGRPWSDVDELMLLEAAKMAESIE
jgi:UDP-N-acetylglucosamine diphosphorylase/glucosamine-1-phosphate N-acetyltransferase